MNRKRPLLNFWHEYENFREGTIFHKNTVFGLLKDLESRFLKCGCTRNRKRVKSVINLLEFTKNTK